MREYVISLLSAAALFSILSLISYKSDGAGKRLAFAVLFIWISLVPLAKILKDTCGIKSPEFDFNISDYTEEYTDVACEAFSAGIKSAVCEKFSLDGENIRILVEGFDFDSMRADKIRIFLSGGAVYASYKDIEKYIEDSKLGECDVEIEIGK